MDCEHGGFLLGSGIWGADASCLYHSMRNEMEARPAAGTVKSGITEQREWP